MSPDSRRGLVEIEEDRIKAGFGECGFVDFRLEVWKRLGGTAIFSEAVLKRRDEAICYQEPKEPFVEHFLK